MGSEAERFIATQIEGELDGDEAILAFGAFASRMSGTILSGLTAKGYLAALTKRRLFLIQTRAGAFGPLLENKGVTRIVRAQIAGCFAIRDHITIVMGDGSKRELQKGTSADKHVPSHARLVERLLAAHGDNKLSKAMRGKDRNKRILTFVVSIAIAAVYLWYKFSGK